MKIVNREKKPYSFAEKVRISIEWNTNNNLTKEATSKKLAKQLGRPYQGVWNEAKRLERERV